jgi:hypothetical protein
MAAAIGKNLANDDMSDDMAPAKGKSPPEKSLQAENGGMIENAVKISIKDQVCCLKIVQSFFVLTRTPFLLGLKSGDLLTFMVKKTTKFRKIFDVYAQRKQVELSSLRFLLDGDRILPEQTPQMLDMIDDDQIDCLLAQIGGFPMPSSASYQ